MCRDEEASSEEEMLVGHQGRKVCSVEERNGGQLLVMDEEKRRTWTEADDLENEWEGGQLWCALSTFLWALRWRLWNVLPPYYFPRRETRLCSSLS